MCNMPGHVGSSIKLGARAWQHPIEMLAIIDAVDMFLVRCVFKTYIFCAARWRTHTFSIGAKVYVVLA